MGFFVSGKPDFIIDEGLFVDEAGAFLEIREQPAADFRVAHKIGFDARDLMGFFIHPDDTGQFLYDALNERARFILGIWLEIEDENVFSAETLAARIDELADAKKDFDSRVVLVFILFLRAFLFPFFFLGFLFGLLLLNFLNAFSRALVFFFLFLRIERFAILGDERGDFLAVEIEKSVIVDFVLGDFAVLVHLRFVFGAPAGIVLADLVDVFLVGVQFFEKFFQVGQLNLRFFGKVENAFADGLIDRNV